MNQLEYYLSKTFLIFFGWIFSLCPLDNEKVVFASARDNVPTGNLAALIKAYQTAYPQAHIVLDFKTYSYGLIGKLQYVLSLVKTTYHLKTARYFFVDNALFPVHVVKHREGTTVVQVWHATGIMKKFGLDTPVKERKVENRFLHKNYDYVIADSEPTCDAYSRAFGTQRERVLALGSARTDALLAPNAAKIAREKLLRKYPELAGKTLLLYAPTFRGFSAQKESARSLDVTSLKQALGSSLAVLYKPHAVITPQASQAFDVVLDSKSDINDYLPGVDGVISDYSSIIFEAALLSKPLYKMCGDYASYNTQNGFYLDYLHDVPGINCIGTHELIKEIKENGVQLSPEQAEQYRVFVGRYCTFSDGAAVQRILNRFPL